MNYTETTEWLFQQLPMFQNKGAAAYKADLKGIVITSYSIHYTKLYEI